MKSKEPDPVVDEEAIIEARRIVRRKYRKVDSMIDPATVYDQLNELRAETNELQEQVIHARELDGDVRIYHRFGKGVKAQAIKLGDFSSSFNMKAFTNSLVSRKVADGSEGDFDWASLGRQVGSMFLSVPPWGAMNGSLDKKIKERKKAERRKADAVIFFVVIRPTFLFIQSLLIPIKSIRRLKRQVPKTWSRRTRRARTRPPPRASRT